MWWLRVKCDNRVTYRSLRPSLRQCVLYGMMMSCVPHQDKEVDLTTNTTHDHEHVNMHHKHQLWKYGSIYMHAHYLLITELLGYSLTPPWNAACPPDGHRFPGLSFRNHVMYLLKTSGLGHPLAVRLASVMHARHVSSYCGHCC